MSDWCLRFNAAAMEVEELTEENEKLKAENERFRRFAESIVQFSKAYPETVFREPTPEQVDVICQSLNLRIDNISAMILRGFTEQWGIMAQAALSGKGVSDE